MVNWSTAEPCPPPLPRVGGGVSQCGTLFQHVRRTDCRSLQTQYLVSDHFHADLQAFPTDIADDLILVSEFCQFCHKIGAHIETDLLRAILFDCLLKHKISYLIYYPRVFLILVFVCS